MEQRLLAPLNAFETSLNALIHSLTATNALVGGPKAARDLVAADDDLDDALRILKAHQNNNSEILHMRAEKDALEQKLKDTVFEAWRLREELGNIHPSILEDTDEEDEEESRQDHNPVDYQTLLSFAMRIGKHNAIAAQEAEKESDRQYLEAKKKLVGNKLKDQSAMNGSHAEDTAPETITRPATSHSVQTQQVQNNIQEIRNAIMYQRALRTAPFPNAEDLRKGALGRLQLIREQHGEEAMEAEAEKMVRESEMQHAQLEPKVEPKPEPPRPEKAERPPAPRPPPPQQQVPLPPRPPTKKIDLDFPGSDDEDDE